ncbi:MAG: trypsin-like serine protease [Mycobacteriaceae bacterium]|nr:trypsin-like serine protease [Mycobacteriaceae bacterium]MBV9640718.1 trypsin-like serine protease [Mycobacteriaceae bacterium]
MARPSPPSPPPTAAPVTANPLIGAVFVGDTDQHTCTGSVLHSQTGDLILTAAHCLAGGSYAAFVPGFSGDAGPAGRWKIGSVYMDPRWLSTQDPIADFAVARVSSAGAASVESVVGRGLALGTAPPKGTLVTVTAYPASVGGTPIGCRGDTATGPRGFPSLSCAGLPAGTSGAPWVSGSSVVGLIGGFHGGGCNDDVSYSPPFDGAVSALVGRAEADGPGDTGPTTFNDGC